MFVNRILATMASFCILAGSCFQSSVFADWYVEAGANFEADLAIYVSSGSGGVSISNIRTGVHADFGFDSIPNNFVFQNWDGSAWPNLLLEANQNSPDSMASAQALIEHSSTTDLFPETASAWIDGKMNGGIDMAAAAVFDFTLNIDDDTVAAVELLDAFAVIEAINAAKGFGFAGVKLYDPTIDVNDYGGANDPFDQDLISLIDNGTAENQDLNLFAEFSDPGSSGFGSLSQNLRVEVFAITFTSVPEPGTAMGLAFVGCILGLRRKRLLAS